jgi:hypothetical protein
MMLKIYLPYGAIFIMRSKSALDVRYCYPYFQVRVFGKRSNVLLNGITH